MTLQLRPLTAADAEAAAAIYNDSVRDTDAALDMAERTHEEALRWIGEHSGPRYPALGATIDGELAGYGTLSPFARRAGYLASAEISIYVAPHRKRVGVGRALCAALTRDAEGAGLSTVLALITSTNVASHRLFASAGYEHTGTMRHIGYKLGRLVDLDVLQRVFPDNFPLYDGTPLEALLNSNGSAAQRGSSARGQARREPGPDARRGRGLGQCDQGDPAVTGR